MQISTRPQPAKKIIDASMPTNISQVDREKLEQKWKEDARIRNEAVDKETKIPDLPKRKIKVELWQFGKHWQAVHCNGPYKKFLLSAPSILNSAMDALTDKLTDEALNG